MIVFSPTYLLPVPVTFSIKLSPPVTIPALSLSHGVAVAHLLKIKGFGFNYRVIYGMELFGPAPAAVDARK